MNLRHYEQYDKTTASPRDRVAWALCQIFDDDAPLRWTRWRAGVDCIASDPEVMKALNSLSPPKGEVEIAFERAMEGKQYGNQEKQDAFWWFRDGWRAAQGGELI